MHQKHWWLIYSTQGTVQSLKWILKESEAFYLNLFYFMEGTFSLQNYIVTCKDKPSEECGF